MSNRTMLNWSSCAFLFCHLSTNYSLAQEYVVNDHKFPAMSLIEALQGTLGVSPSGARDLNPVAFELIKHFEGWVPTAYNDAVNYCTIGYGHLIALKPCQNLELGEFSTRISLEKGSELLRRDTLYARNAVQDFVKVELNDDQYGALVSFVFNVGAENFRKSSMLKMINESRFDLAADQFSRWAKAKGKVFEGLLIRRACERTLFLGQLELGKNGRFERTSCSSLGAAPEGAPLIDIDQGEQ